MFGLQKTCPVFVCNRARLGWFLLETGSVSLKQAFMASKAGFYTEESAEGDGICCMVAARVCLGQSHIAKKPMPHILRPPENACRKAGERWQRCAKSQKPKEGVAVPSRLEALTVISTLNGKANRKINSKH